jgi:hypothetical protein
LGKENLSAISALFHAPHRLKSLTLLGQLTSLHQRRLMRHQGISGPATLVALHAVVSSCRSSWNVLPPSQKFPGIRPVGKFQGNFLLSNAPNSCHEIVQYRQPLRTRVRQTRLGERSRLTVWFELPIPSALVRLARMPSLHASNLHPFLRV